ncbi:MAG: cupredoxin domain-containing protein [Armatimonadota bacterium]|nr:cupredoxin domain-containing protein [Armatimonadota bacterium]
MTIRILLALGLVLITALGFAASVPAQTPQRVVEVTMTSFKFEPSQITINEGERVVIRLRNADQAGRPHDIASRYFVDLPLTVRGDGRQAVEEGRKYVRVDAGKQAEFEFVAANRGSYAFICSVFLHSAAGMTGAIFVKPQGAQ